MVRFQRFLSGSENSFFLFGPRGTGKTLWIQSSYGDALKVDLLVPEIFFKLFTEPGNLRDDILGAMALTGGKKFTVAIDEIQRIPELLNVIHSMVVEFPNIQFVMTGSSARKLRRAGVNLLGGRASLRSMHPFMAAEMGEHFSLTMALKIGLLPVIHGQSNPMDALKSYVGTYLDEEVKHESIVRKLGAFAKFLRIASFSHGSVPNRSAIARECGISTPTVSAYFEILDDLLLSFSVPIFSYRAKRTLIKAEKFYLCDTGIFQCLHPHGALKYDDSISGIALEGLVAQHLRAWCHYSSGDNQLYYWHTKGGSEVDFIVHGDVGLWAFEVKQSPSPAGHQTAGLRQFRIDYPDAKLCLLHGGKEISMHNGILFLPCDRFLRSLKPDSMPFQ
jgi:predicted AAA+ superfamily ATPase